MTVDKNIKKSLANYFPELKGQALDDAINISNKLSNGAKSKNVQSALNALEASMKSAADAKNKFGTVLSITERTGGINIDVEGNTVVPTVLRPLEPDEGIKLLEFGKIWKDPGIDAGSNGHGEHTHRIQWFIVISQKLSQTRPNELLIEISRQSAKEGGTASALWDCLFDRVTFGVNHPGRPPFGPNGSEDFRCPEHLNKYLTGKAYPHIAAALKKNQLKRDDAAGYHGDSGYQLALKAAIKKIVGGGEGARDPYVAAYQEFYCKTPGNDNNDTMRWFTAAVDYGLKKQGLKLDGNEIRWIAGQPLGVGDCKSKVEKAMEWAVSGYLMKINRDLTV